jgi:acetyl esterase/lipase
MSPITVESGPVFATVGDTTLELDIYRAPDHDAPLVIYVHRGGWRSGDKTDETAERIAPLARYGVTVAAVNYHLVPAATFPDQLHDLKGAVRSYAISSPAHRDDKLRRTNDSAF